MNKVLYAILFFGLISVLGCNSEGRNEESNDKPAHFSSTISCDSVSWLGTSFDFPKNIRIDSVRCLKEGIKVDATLWKNEDANEVVIYDTFLYKNEYKLIVYAFGKPKQFSIKKIRWKSQHVYHGAVCNLISCEFNNQMIKDNAGSFDIPSELITEEK